MKNYQEQIQEWHELIEGLINYGGAPPSPPDPRDYAVEDIPMASAALPPKLHLPPSPIILNQGQTGYCAGASGAGIANAYYNSHNQMPEDGFSMAFLYWLAKEHDGIPHINGTYISTVLKIMRHYGCAPEKLAPYSLHKINITEQALKIAEQYKIEAYARLYTPNDIRTAYAKGLYVIYGTLVTSENWRRTYLSYPKGTLYGGHATHGFGYDDYLRESHVGYYSGQNSWGPYAHTNGKFFMPYDIHKMTHEGRPYFLEAWGIKFYDLEDKKKEELPPSPLAPKILFRPKLRLRKLWINPQLIQNKIQKRFEELRKLLQR